MRIREQFAAWVGESFRETGRIEEED